MTDPASETDDPITGTINWGDGDTTSISGRSISESHTYAAGSHTIQISVNDGDGGTATKTQAVALLYTMGAIQSPFNADGSSVFKFGSTIPVKVRVSDCLGNAVPGLTLRVGWTAFSAAVPPTPINEEGVYSTSAADTGNTMRYDADAGQYIYNFNSKSLADSTASYYMNVTSALTSPSQKYVKFGIKTK